MNDSSPERLTASPTAAAVPDDGDSLFQDDQIFADYRIVRRLGKGGMGEVYEADDLVNGRRVALKIVDLARGSPVALQRFLREGQLAASLSHPNSVYVFGSGEAEGIPFIVSELVTGGTLAERVSASGPLPVSDAVDAILDVIAGLSAAAELGILHRDVKPSNCFVMSDGHVKVGDFGVSIPLDARERTDLTLTGVIVGTPSYCAPEQLKGEELDERSDIYSVGATLFYLLVGHPPFRSSDIVRLIEQVLIAPPPLPGQHRPEIPARLSQLVAACLSKSREQRPATYDALTAELRPFSSASPAPAPVAPRILAAVLDGLLLVVIWNLVTPITNVALAWADLSASPAQEMARAVATILYFSLQEYWAGASVGKRLCGIRVAAADGSPIGFWRSCARAGIVFAALSVPTPVTLGSGVRVMMSPGPLGLLTALLLFVTARRANGNSGVHEILTGSRTLDRQAPSQAREQNARLPAAGEPSSSESIGPYRVVRRYDQHPELVLTRDERLRRLVWLRLATRDEEPVSAGRRDLTRAQRFRWLGAKRSEAAGWNAYEYVEGGPFANAHAGRTPLHTVLQWLAALARECRASAADGTLPSIGLDRLWISRRGDLKVADWPLPEADEHESYSTSDVRRCQQLLSRVAVYSLNRGDPPVPLPVFGHALLSAFERAAFADFDELVTACEDAAARDDCLSAQRRLASIAAVFVLAALPLVLVLSQVTLLSRSLSISHQFQLLSICMRQLDSLERGQPGAESSGRREFAEMCVSYASRSLTPSAVDAAAAPYPGGRSRISAARARYPNVSFSDFAERTGDLPSGFNLEPYHPDTEAAERRDLAVWMTGSALTFSIRLLAAFGVAGIILALLFREGLLFRVLGIAVVRPDGGRASRVRAAAWALVVWLPAFVAFALLPSPFTADTWKTFVAGVPVALMAAAAVYAVRHPSRGIPELITRTYLVRR